MTNIKDNSNTAIRERAPAREAIKQDTQNFLDSGGKITHISIGSSSHDRKNGRVAGGYPRQVADHIAEERGFPILNTAEARASDPRFKHRGNT